MIPRALLALMLALCLGAPARASAASETEETPHPTLLGNTLKMLHLQHDPKPKAAEGGVIRDGMELRVSTDPDPIALSSTHQVKVIVSLTNRGHKYIHLDFSTSQRIEVIVRDNAGKAVTTWSEDQSFSQDPASVTINPGEHLEYSASVATREMAAGHEYTIEVSFPSYPDLKVERKVTPVR